jgi:hypothetical protein
VLHVYRSKIAVDEYFNREEDITINQSNPTFTIKMNVDELVTISTIIGKKGKHVDPPKPKRFPLIHTDSFDKVPIDQVHILSSFILVLYVCVLILFLIVSVCILGRSLFRGSKWIIFSDFFY